MKLSDFLLMLKGGAGSGNWGHSGRPGERGGSAVRTGGLLRMGLTSSASVEQRQSRSSLQKIERANYQKGFFDEKGNYFPSFETRQSRRILDAIVNDNLEKREKLKAQIDKVGDKINAEFDKILDDPKAEERMNKYIDQQRKLQEKMDDLKRQVNSDNADLRARHLFFPENRGDAKLVGPDDFQSGVKEFNKLVSSELTQGKQIEIESKPGVRSYYDPTYEKVVMGNNTDHVVVHEMGHWLESQNHKVAVTARTFLQNRTRGEEAKPLADVTKNSFYRPEETTKVDRFINPYMGKRYDDGGTEIISMGLEYIYKDPVIFRKADPEYFEFMIDVMNNRIQ